MTDLLLTQGDDFIRRISVLQEGQPADISDWQFKMQARKNAYSEPIFTLENDSGITIADNYAWLDIASSDTATFAAGDYIYDLECTHANRTTKLLRGTLRILAEVTK